MVNIFIDTEFTDFIDTHLISIGMVTAKGEEFYAEVPYPENACSPFVREAVIPLLGKYPQCIFSAKDLQTKMLDWLSSLRPIGQRVNICFDYQTDWDLFADALDYCVPEWCAACLVAEQINEISRYEFYERSRLPRHHALYDARANCIAFIEEKS
ncbi:3'-5' exoribonuclease [Undibacterium jejuense]|uniref:3'-5' exoribonuclease n=1 Tax=Undibacterium jejuense TaxID=1344949 RepID=A0A923HPM7_9BURK|nr:3'-5' exoribonuclease [Undibacterium jejuense]MBC3862433.1 3'-5' exoribonuclease [Undibacterium jejuense]